MWFLVVTRQLSCFSAFADLHGLSSLTCCFYEYIRADAVNRFDLATQPRDIFFLYSFSKINFGRWPELTCGHWHQPRFWFQFELQFCSWFCCTTMIFFSAYFILFYFFCDSGLDLIQYSQCALSPHDNCFGYSCDPELQPLITGMLLALLNHAVHFRLDCFEADSA